MIRVRDFLDFILKNRGKTLLINWNESEILNAIRESLHEKTLFYSKNEKNEITGICIIKIEGKVFHVVAILLLYKEQLRKYFEYFNKNYEGYELRGFRRAKLVTYDNPKQILEKLNDKSYE